MHRHRLAYRPAAMFWVVLLVTLSSALGSPVTNSSAARISATLPPHPLASLDSQFSPQMRIGFPAGDDWEPAMAADSFDHLYAVYLHMDVPQGATCAGCNLHLLVQRSRDGGKTWTSPIPIGPGRVQGGQFDPWIVVDPVDGRTVWISFMQDFPNSVIEIVKSTDFGATWSQPQVVSNRPPGLDKDILAVRGDLLAVSFDDYMNTWAAVSEDGGQSWTTHLIAAVTKAPTQLLSSGGGIDSLGNIYFSWGSYDSSVALGPAKIWMVKSEDSGQSWSEMSIATSGAPPPCRNCGAGAYLAPQLAMRVGSDDTIYVLWNGTTDLTNGAAQRIFFARSTDHGNSYSARIDVSTAPAGVEHGFPALAVGSLAGDVRTAWVDLRTGSWNVFYRPSADGGQTFGDTTRISGSVPGGSSYLTPEGFLFPYGDYFQMAVDSSGLAHLAFGESPAYTKPGNIWVSNQQ